METVADCALCLLKLAHTSASAAGASEPARLAAVKAALDVLARDDFSRIPPAIARDVLEAVNDRLETDDPFREMKSEHNTKARALAAEWAPGYIGMTSGNENRLARTLRVALVGNGLDLATLPDEADPANFRKWIDVPWAINHFDDFCSKLAGSSKVLYLCDNAGEIAFDSYLIRELAGRGKQVTVSVKGGPALNDAERRDAAEAGINELIEEGMSVELIDTGQANMGVDLSSTGPEWTESFNTAELILAKGQANLESLHNAGREIFFLTLIKCSHVAKYYGLPKGAAMFYRGGIEA